MSTLVFASVQCYGEVFTLSNPGTAASVHARQAIPLVYTRIDGVAAPAGETIAALTYATTLTSGATFDQTLCDWAIVTHTGTLALLVVPLASVIALPALIATGTYAILAWITRDRIYPWPQIAIPSMKTEGGMWRNRSIGDPTDPTTPPVPTEMPVGDVGQLIQVVPDATGYMSPFDPNQATNHTADPAYTTLTLANGLMAAWKYDANGNPLLSEIPVGTDGQVLAAKSNPSAHDNTGATVASDEPIYQNIAWVLGHLLTAAGDLVKGVGGGADAAKMARGAQYQVLTSDGADALWKDLAYSLVHYLQSTLPAKGDMLTMDASDMPTRVDTGIGTADQILTVVSGLPSWQDIRKALGNFLGALGTLPTGAAGGADATVLTPGADKTILRSHGTGAALTWDTVAAVLGRFLPNAGDLPIGHGSSADADVLGRGTNGQLLKSTSSTLAWDDLSALLASIMGDGNLITKISGALGLVSIGGSGQVLASNGTYPIWGDLAAILKAVLLPNDGDMLINGAGSVQALSAPSVPSVLCCVGTTVFWSHPTTSVTTYQEIQVKDTAIQWVIP